MFTGIIETMGTVIDIETTGSNRSFIIQSSLAAQLKIDQSVSHNGACLTIEKVAEQTHRVTAIEETLKKTTLALWKKGDQVNLERCLTFNGRIDGHLVQGHVDGLGSCTAVKDHGGSWQYTIEFPVAFAPMIIEKGSICVNGISLTAFNVQATSFEVAIIPYTYQHTTIQYLQPGQQVNLEFDLLGKYLQRQLQLKSDGLL